MKSHIGATLHMAGKRRGLGVKIAGELVTFYDGPRQVWRGIGPDAAKAYLAGVPSLAKKKRKRGPRSGVRKLRAGEIGIESTDHTPKGARGLVLTRIMLPPEISSDSALIDLWVGENIATGRSAPAIYQQIGTARAAMARAKPVDVWLSDHDRASLARYPAPASVVLIAAAFAKRVRHNSR